MTTQPTPYVIVVAYDFSQPAHRAIEQAIELGQGRESWDLHVLGVLDDRAGLGDITGANKIDYAAAEKSQEVIRASVEKILLEARATPHNLYVHARIGTPAKEIVELAAEATADILVVGTHGRSGVGRWLLGSVAEKVVRYAPCPVLVARPHPEHGVVDQEFQPEPPCPACVARRQATGGATWWCDEHGREHLKPQVFSYSNRIAQTRSGPSPLL
ncbi:MAG TPA: universal stress protein [Kofleriaceae bacterium]|nr:universal stress protein [Kofleriaceae bacterium]